MGTKDGCDCMGAVLHHFTHPECFYPKSVLGRVSVEILCYACMEWASSVDGDMISCKTLNAGLEDPNFKVIVGIDSKMRAENNPDIVPKFLVEMTQLTGQACLLVPFTYLTGTTPHYFRNYHLGGLGKASALPDLMQRMGCLRSGKNIID
jgi:hypothetical protein